MEQWHSPRLMHRYVSQLMFNILSGKLEVLRVGKVHVATFLFTRSEVTLVLLKDKGALTKFFVPMKVPRCSSPMLMSSRSLSMLDLS